MTENAAGFSRRFFFGPSKRLADKKQGIQGVAGGLADIVALDAPLQDTGVEHGGFPKTRTIREIGCLAPVGRRWIACGGARRWLRRGRICPVWGPFATRCGQRIGGSIGIDHVTSLGCPVCCVDRSRQRPEQRHCVLPQRLEELATTCNRQNWLSSCAREIWPDPPCNRQHHPLSGAHHSAGLSRRPDWGIG